MASAGLPVFAAEGIATPAQVRNALQKLQAQIAQTSFSVAFCHDVNLLLAEVLNNIAEHAYAGITPGHFHVIAYCEGSGLRINFRDVGRPMPGGRLPGGIPQNIRRPTRDLPEGGFGWALIRELSREIAYHRHDGENLLVVTMSPDA